LNSEPKDTNKLGQQHHGDRGRRKKNGANSYRDTHVRDGPEPRKEGGEKRGLNNHPPRN